MNPIMPNASTEEAKQLPNLDFVHNTDLRPSDAYVASLPRLRRVLRYPPLLELFQRYDDAANSMQRTLRVTGATSLWLGSIALTGTTAKLLVAALGGHMLKALTVVFEVSALTSILLALGPWFARTRTRWLTARFVTEQIRQWQFQMMHDGDLVSKAHSAPEEFESIRATRWAQFTAQFASAEGAMVSFIDGERVDVGHPVSAYRDAETAAEAYRAYIDLRFQRQLAYFKVSRHKFAARDEWSEAVARWTLFSAVILAAAQLGLMCLPVREDAQYMAGACIAAGALVLVILSMAIRVYRSALALSQQRERYDSKWMRLVALKSEFDGATSAKAKVHTMHDVEVVEIEECLEFLRQMCRASYLL